MTHHHLSRSIRTLIVFGLGMSLFLTGGIASALADDSSAMTEATPLAKPSLTLALKSVHLSVSGEQDETTWEMIVGTEPGSALFSKASIGGVEVTVNGSVAAAAKGEYPIKLNISESSPGEPARGPNGQILTVTQTREREISVTIAPGQDVRTGAQPAPGDQSRHPVEAIILRLDTPQTLQQSAAPAIPPSTAAGEWRVNEEAPRKSGLRLPGKKQPQYMIEFRADPADDTGGPLANFNPKVLTLASQPARIEMKGADEMIAIVAQVKKDDAGVIEFQSTMTREQEITDAAAGETTMKVSEKLEREMTLRPGEEKEVGEFMGAMIHVIVTRVE